MGQGILNIHKNRKEREMKEFQEKEVPGIVSDFMRFQVEHNSRAMVVNKLGHEDTIINLIMSQAGLMWVPLNEEEKKAMQEELAKKAGIHIAKEEDLPNGKP